MAPVTITFSDHTIVPPVYVAGSFSEWKVVGLDASWYQSELGEDRFAYQKTLDLEPGVYQYKFRLGTGDWWVCDTQSLQARDENGNENNLLIIGEKSLERFVQEAATACKHIYEEVSELADTKVNRRDNSSYKKDAFAKLLGRNVTETLCTNCSKDDISNGTKPNQGVLTCKETDDRKNGLHNQADSDRDRRTHKHSRAGVEDPKPLRERARPLGPGISGDNKLLSPDSAKSDLDRRRRSMPAKKQTIPESSTTRRSSQPVNHAPSGSNATRKLSQPTNRLAPDSPLAQLRSRTQTLPTRQATPDPMTDRRRSSTLSNTSSVKRVHSQPVDRVTTPEASVRRISTQPLRQSIPWSSGRTHRCYHDRPHLQMSSTFDETVDWTPVPLDKKAENRSDKKTRKESVAARALDMTKNVLILTAAALTGPVIFAIYDKKDNVG